MMESFMIGDALGDRNSRIRKAAKAADDVRRKEHAPQDSTYDDIHVTLRHRFATIGVSGYEEQAGTSGQVGATEAPQGGLLVILAKRKGLGMETRDLTARHWFQAAAAPQTDGIRGGTWVSSAAELRAE
ncbi:hypothetical protein CLCR_11225 [Cladophialophora carrionii]|uniref:Uncharacterized protein n=1 Tax=Cladophialophora carrionii TaxID=86049 RepID=A0A1C1C9N6_9EURO|nr:hypothetical protein CLCR_11225 [Cladophialophora carrionii]